MYARPRAADSASSNSQCDDATGVAAEHGRYTKAPSIQSASGCGLAKTPRSLCLISSTMQLSAGRQFSHGALPCSRSRSGISERISAGWSYGHRYDYPTDGAATMAVFGSLHVNDDPRRMRGSPSVTSQLKDGEHRDPGMAGNAPTTAWPLGCSRRRLV